MIKKFRTYLHEPYPQRDDVTEILRNAAIATLIVFFILVVFRPFGFAEVDNWIRWKLSAIFGGITFAVVLAYELFVKYIVRLNRNHPDWTFWKWLVSNLLMVACITAANYFFTIHSYGLPHSLRHFANIFLNTLSIGLFPFILFGLVIVQRQSRRNEKIASEIQIDRTTNSNAVQPEVVRLPIHQSEQFFEIDSEKILCVEAMQNYVQIYYNQEGEILKKVLRNTISSIEQSLLSTNIRRSHRSFLVNTARIENVSGNAQGLKLQIDPSPGFWIPVSRKYIPSFKKIA